MAFINSAQQPFCCVFVGLNGIHGLGKARAEICVCAGKRLGSSERSQLQANQDWEDSRFSALESFIADYLSGGASSGEGVRLKLQTPLFVSEALLDTAQKQLADLIATAEQVGWQYILTDAL